MRFIEAKFWEKLSNCNDQEKRAGVPQIKRVCSVGYFNLESE
jgi:hypothetical protein